MKLKYIYCNNYNIYYHKLSVRSYNNNNVRKINDFHKLILFKKNHAIF